MNRRPSTRPDPRLYEPAGSPEAPPAYAEPPVTLGAALLALALALILGFAIAGFAVAVRNGQTPDAPPPGADLAPISVLQNAMYQYDQTNGWVPPDPVLAVGPSSVFVPANDYSTLFDKDTLTPLFKTEGFAWPNPGGPGGDGLAIYDEMSGRFFYTTWNDEYVGATVAASNGSNFRASPANYGPVTFDVTAPLIAADPITGAVHRVPTLNNAAACAGKIVVFEGGGGIYSYDKAQLALAAGAVGMIFIVPQGIGLQSPSDVRPPLSLPVVGVAYPDGIALLSILGSTRVYSIPGVIYNQIAIAVSKDSNPKTPADFYVYQYASSYAGVEDFPKFAVDATHLYLTSQRFIGYDHSYDGVAIATFSKAALLAGPGGSFVVPLRVTVLPTQGFLWPAVNRYPLADLMMPTFFVGWNDNQTAWRIYTSSVPANGLAAFADYYDVPFPEPFAFVGGQANRQAVAAQPAPGKPIEASLGPYSMSPVLVGQSLWLAMTMTPSNITAIVRWVELDVSQFLVSLNITVKQYGDLNQMPGMNTYMPALNVDKHGNMAVVFTMSSESANPTLAYTGRLASDPPGTIRFPYQTPIESLYSYAMVYPLERTSFNRWGDYAACVVDPSDGETFYATAEQPSQLWADTDGVTSYVWSMPIVRFKVAPAAGAAGAATASAPLPTASAPWSAPSEAVEGIDAGDAQFL